jgi:hypothetical protein
VQLGHGVAGRRLAGEQVHPRDGVQVGLVLDLQVRRDHLQAGQQLALVFVDALDLHHEHRLGRQLDPDPPLHEHRQVALVGPLDRRQRLQERLSSPSPAICRSSRRSRSIQLLPMRELIRRVSRGLEYSSQRPGRDPVGLVAESLWPQGAETPASRLALDQLGCAAGPPRSRCVEPTVARWDIRTCLGAASSMIDRRASARLARPLGLHPRRKLRLISKMICRWRGNRRSKQRGTGPLLQRLGHQVWLV